MLRQLFAVCLWAFVTFNVVWWCANLTAQVSPFWAVSFIPGFVVIMWGFNFGTKWAANIPSIHDN